MKSLRLVLLGPPASGKGTQGRLMTERWGVAVTSVGEMLRRETAAGTALGVEAATFTDHGRLVPDQVALAVVDAWLAEHQGDSFVFDGFPRTVGQAEALETILAERHALLDAALWLELEETQIKKRVSRRLTCAKCGHTFAVGWQIEDASADCPLCGGGLIVRHDDDPLTLNRRMIEYRERTEPVTEFYETRALLRRIDANQLPEEVFARIEAAV